MSQGFLGNNASFLLDAVVCALAGIVPVLAVSLWLVRARRYTIHKRLQIALAIALLVSVIALEIDLQVVHGGWRSMSGAEGGLGLTGDRLEFARNLLRVHLVFAVTTPLLWTATIWLALCRFPDPPRPATHSRWHKRLGWTSAADLLLTVITGIAFYWVVFVAG